MKPKDNGVARYDDFPRLSARTQRFTLGRPRQFTVSPDGQRIWWLSSARGDDPVHHLWLHTIDDGVTRRIVDATAVGVDDTSLTDAERARRERSREGGGGITTYATDRDARQAVFVLGGEVFVVDVDATMTAVVTDGPGFDARLSPDGRFVAVVVDGGLHLADLRTTGTPTALPLHVPTPGQTGVTFGMAEFIAAEEMDRSRGYWFSGDGRHLLVARVDESEVVEVHLSDPVHPRREPRPHRYPFAGTANATVTLDLVELDATDPDTPRAASVRPVTGVADHYLATVSWENDQPALVTWQDRAQTTVTVCTLDVETAVLETREVITGTPWVELVPGAPTWAGGALLTVRADDTAGPEGTHVVALDGRVISPAGLQVRSIVDADAERVVVTASRDDPTNVEVVVLDPAGGAPETWSTGAGVHAAVVAGPTRVEVSATPDAAATATIVTDHGRITIEDHSIQSGLEPRPQYLKLAGLAGALFVPEGTGPFPVLLDPYGGPHAQRVMRARNLHLTPQWFCEQGLAVLVVDGRGTPGRSPAFEHAVRGDLADGVLNDQVAALQAAGEYDDRLDLTRVAIRGWSFGGFLAALAALRRPDVFRAAIVGAPVTDWRLYDTHYTERYLGHPDTEPDAYTQSSLVDPGGDLVGAVVTDDPAHMLIIHGLVDDNVLAAHSLRLSRALLSAGRPHRFLPLSGVTHMTPQEEVAANLLRLQLTFLREVLG